MTLRHQVPSDCPSGDAREPGVALSVKGITDLDDPRAPTPLRGPVGYPPHILPAPALILLLVFMVSLLSELLSLDDLGEPNQPAS
jgi:hypothetical protein